MVGPGRGEQEQQQRQRQPCRYSAHHCCCECSCRKYRHHFIIAPEPRSQSHARPPSPHAPRDGPGMPISEAREKWPRMKRKGLGHRLFLSFIDEVMEQPKSSDTAVLVEGSVPECRWPSRRHGPQRPHRRARSSRRSCSWCLWRLARKHRLCATMRRGRCSQSRPRWWSSWQNID